MDYAEPNTYVNERTHNWQHLYSIYLQHGTGQIEDNELNEGETKVRILRCVNCGQHLAASIEMPPDAAV